MSTTSTTTTSLDDTVVHRKGEVYGSREYVLLSADTTLEDLASDPSLKLASIYAHRNIIFGATARDGRDMTTVCGPLVDAALEDASETGEQPQGIASLTGLCAWVALSIESGGDENPVLSRIRQTDEVGFRAIKAISTGIPRPGHSVVGIGTFRDGQESWEKLAREFIQLDLSIESNLYKSRNGELVGIEHMADRSESYLKSAGGAMARFFFL